VDSKPGEAIQALVSAAGMDAEMVLLEYELAGMLAGGEGNFFPLRLRHMGSDYIPPVAVKLKSPV